MSCGNGNDVLAAIERDTQEIGRALFESLDTQRPNILQRRWWDNRIMSWAMKDESLKVQLFRFVDVLPMLTSREELCGHLLEYLGSMRDRLPMPLSVALGISRLNPIAQAAVARAARLGAMDLARRFIAGTNVGEVLGAAMRERDQNRAFTLDILGEAVTSEEEAELFFQAYLRLIEQLAPQVNRWPAKESVDWGVLGPLPRLNLSIKLSALDHRFDPIDPDGSALRAGGRLRELLRVARRNRAFINVDMESYDKKDLTLDIFKQVLSDDEFRDVGDVGIVVQCYLRDADQDLRALRDWAAARGKPVWVRLVKGAYWDYETVHAGANDWPIPVFQQKWRSDDCFESATCFVMQNHQHLRPALGTHNLRSIAHGIAAAQQFDLPANGFEIQMLYGMADAEKQVLVDRGHRLRIYMPYGELIPGMAYLVRRLLENTSNQSFLRAGLVEQVPPEELLRKPHDQGQDETQPVERTMTTDAAPESFAATFKNQPPVDFAQQKNRKAMRGALGDVMMQLGREYPLVIAGAAVKTEETLASFDPSFKDRLVGGVSCATRAHVEDAVVSAQNALTQWRALGAEHRAGYLRGAAQVIRERLFELAAWEVYECGKGWREATNDICEAIDFCDYYADGAVSLEQRTGADVPGEENRFEYTSRGVVAVIAPWNFPLAILTGMTAAALATGNTVIMKPAEQSSVVAAQLMQIFGQLDLPPGVLHFLPGRGEIAGAALVEHPQVALIAFTGSREVGLRINVRAAEISASGGSSVKRVIAEMGGKNAIIVDSDADLDEAVQGVIQSAFGFQGQKCSACSRVIVLESVYDAFAHRLTQAANSLTIGAAELPSTDVGPVIDETAFQKTHEYIAIGKEEGKIGLSADLSEPLARQGYYVAPHIFVDVEPQARIAQEEIFGPVLAVIRAADFDQAIQISNSTDYALTGGLFSRSPENLDRARRELMVGNLYLNRSITGAIVGRQPFGGFKMSGIGSKAGGRDYLLQFVIPRTVTENTMRRGFAPE